MKRSDSIVELATALSKAQVQFGAARKTGTNPMFKSDYATFDDIIGAVRAPLSEAGLSYMQMLDEHAGLPALTTTLMHASGEWVESTVPLVSISGNRGTNEVQAFGSALTYMKRYALASMLGVASDEDDDGNAARKAPLRQTQTTQPRQQQQEDDTTGSPAYLDVSEVGVFVTKGGKRHLGFMAEGHKWSDARWWNGRDALLEAAPWLAESCTKERLGEIGARFPFVARMYYTEDVPGGYKTAERFERID